MSYGQNNPYGNAEQGYGGQQYSTGNYSEYGANNHEMQSYSHTPQQSLTLSQQDFLQRVGVLRSEIGNLTNNVRNISYLHQRALESSDSGQSSQQLERLVSETQSLNAGIRDQLKFLATDAHKTTDGSKSMKDRQVETLKNEFQRELRKYQEAEQAFRQRYRDQVARQYRIVNPDATEAEVQQIVDSDEGTEGVFQTALRTNRTGQAASVLGSVRARHNELQRIEQTIIELAQMFNDLAVLVEQQEVAIDTAQQNAENTTKYIDDGNQHVKKGIVSARNARKWKWYCLLVVILIIIAVALGVGLGIYLNKPK